jgi:hypothetical protein
MVRSGGLNYHFLWKATKKQKYSLKYPLNGQTLGASYSGSSRAVPLLRRTLCRHSNWVISGHFLMLELWVRLPPTHFHWFQELCISVPAFNSVTLICSAVCILLNELKFPLAVFSILLNLQQLNIICKEIPLGSEVGNMMKCSFIHLYL